MMVGAAGAAGDGARETGSRRVDGMSGAAEALAVSTGGLAGAALACVFSLYAPVLT
jgi:hypothetical protein